MPVAVATHGARRRCATGQGIASHGAAGPRVCSRAAWQDRARESTSGGGTGTIKSQGRGRKTRQWRGRGARARATGPCRCRPSPCRNAMEPRPLRPWRVRSPRTPRHATTPCRAAPRRTHLELVRLLLDLGRLHIVLLLRQRLLDLAQVEQLLAKLGCARLADQALLKCLELRRVPLLHGCDQLRDAMRSDAKRCDVPQGMRRNTGMGAMHEAPSTSVGCKRLE